VVPFAHLPTEVIAKVVDKFVMQLEAQLADRNVSIELSDEARTWLIERGYDQAMGARPMARVIQTHIKTPLADEVLFGRLKSGGTVRVVTAGSGADSKLVFVFPDGPVLPRPDKEIVEATRKKVRPEPEVRARSRKPKAAPAPASSEE
jgi:ATP-dependent Clp protease ATP-binding subunit ClpA